MKKVSTLVASGVAVCLLFCGTAALCQEVAPKVASNVPVVSPTEHPLMPVIRWAERGKPKIAAVKDYTARMQKQENLDGEVQEAQVMDIKIRHQPFSVYLKFRYPAKLNGQQAIYVQGQNDGKLIGHGVGIERAFGTNRLAPDSFLAMRGNKYPITDIGILNLVDKLLEVGYKDSKFGECTVTYTENVKIGGGDAERECTMIEVTHPVPRTNFIFHVARIYVDKELDMPIRYESYGWPRKPGETPQLIEVYTYLYLKLNVGLTDMDFDHTNPAYNFPR